MRRGTGIRGTDPGTLRFKRQTLLTARVDPGDGPQSHQDRLAVKVLCLGEKVRIMPLSGSRTTW